MAETLLQVRNLRTEFRTRRRTVVAVDDVSFDLGRGEILGVVGESGSGKSVTMLSVMGLERPVGGVVSYRGQDLVALRRAELRALRGDRIAMVFQDPMKSLNPVLSVGHQLAEPLRTHKGIGRAEARDRAVELLEMVGIPGAARRVRHFPHQFSGGMRQRVMIAMALSCDPEILIADEPTTALDVTVQAQILELIKRLRDERSTAVVLVSHDLGVVAGMADRICVMYAGRIVETGTVDEVFSRPHHPYTIGLLASIPRDDIQPGTRLEAIPGSPPDLTDLPRGCAFRDRCAFATDRCGEQAPALEPVAGGAGGHLSACWLDRELAPAGRPGSPNGEVGP